MLGSGISLCKVCSFVGMNRSILITKSESVSLRCLRIRVHSSVTIDPESPLHFTLLFQVYSGMFAENLKLPVLWECLLKI